MESENGRQKYNDVCAIGWNVVSRDVKRDGTRRRFSESLVCSPVRAGKRDPAYPSKITGSRGGRRRNYQGRFRRRGGRSWGRSLISVRRIVPAPVRRARCRCHGFRAGRRGNLRLRFPGAARADSAYENILFFASAFRSGHARRASRSRRCHGTRAAGILFRNAI